MGARHAWVVLVEDDSATAEMYRLGLEVEGLEVSIVASGEALFDLLESRVPDAFVLDYQLPGANGAEVLEAIRRNLPTSETVVFMLSNFPPSHDGGIDRVFELGAIAWLQKANTSPVTLAAKLREALGFRGQRLCGATRHTTPDTLNGITGWPNERV